MKYFLILLFLISPQISSAAVAFVSATNMVASQTASVDTGTGANRVACVTASAQTDILTGVTVGSDTLSFQTKVAVSGYNINWMYCGVLTVTGTQTVTISGSGTYQLNTTLLYSGAGTPKNAVTNTGNGTSGTVTASPTPASTSWLVGGGANDSIVIVAGSNTTCRNVNGCPGDSAIGAFDSNGVASPTALNTTVAGNWAMFAVEIPVPSAAATPTSLLGLIRAFWIF